MQPHSSWEGDTGCSFRGKKRENGWCRVKAEAPHTTRILIELSYTTPWSIMASTTLINPAIFAPAT